MHEEILRLEEAFTQAILNNDADTIADFLGDDWIVIDPDGGIVEKAGFLAAVRSGMLTHEAMQSDDTRVRRYEDTAVFTALTTTKGKFMGQAFTTHERATDVFVKRGERWSCVLTQLTRFTQK
jgi:ketosteroid isomerase-like protein